MNSNSPVQWAVLICNNRKCPYFNMDSPHKSAIVKPYMRHEDRTQYLSGPLSSLLPNFSFPSIPTATHLVLKKIIVKCELCILALHLGALKNLFKCERANCSLEMKWQMKKEALRNPTSWLCAECGQGCETWIAMNKIQLVVRAGLELRTSGT